MRPASEIHSALALAENEIAGMMERYRQIREKTDDEMTKEEVDFINGLVNVELLRDVLSWVAGKSALDITGEHEWLVGFLLDDPPRIDDTPPERN